MAKQCDLFGTKSKKAANRSHSNVKTLRRQYPNLHTKKYEIPELGKKVEALLCTKGIRTVTKYGTLREAILRTSTAQLSPKFAKLKVELQKISSTASTKKAA